KRIDPIAFEKECTFRTARSSGKGGQNVNKVETKVILVFSVAASELFDENEKAALHQKLAARLTQKGMLQVSCDRERSQLKNKSIAVTRAIAILEKALQPVKPRRKTKPTKASVEKRLQDKLLLARKKELRIKM
ncbi:MAG: aminoacyl-tRNA hydrolase, partial [Prevotellaceae bacterium]|nr:aminoacyl-tRNA hydrolase [Prevotellaceae bacterium]